MNEDIDENIDKDNDNWAADRAADRVTRPARNLKHNQLSRPASQSRKTPNAFVLTHFGNRRPFFEATIYFIYNLLNHTTQNIIWMYSVIDTPPVFVEIMKGLVFSVVPYNEYDILDLDRVTVIPGLRTLGTIRTCGFIFAYNLNTYTRLCLIENDMVVVDSIDDIFTCDVPAMRAFYYDMPMATYRRKYRANKNMPDLRATVSFKYSNTRDDVLKHGHVAGLANGGIMVIKPSKKIFKDYVRAVPIVLGYGAGDGEQYCKYPNETLFEYVNLEYYNLPAQFHTSHYHCRTPLALYNLPPQDIRVFHYNETLYKPVEIAKRGRYPPRFANSLGEAFRYYNTTTNRSLKYTKNGDPINCSIIGYKYFKDKVYDVYAGDVSAMMQKVDDAFARDAVVDDDTMKLANDPSLAKTKGGATRGLGRGLGRGATRGLAQRTRRVKIHTM